jgi:hypothetical protein
LADFAPFRKEFVSCAEVIFIAQEEKHAHHFRGSSSLTYFPNLLFLHARSLPSNGREIFVYLELELFAFPLCPVIVFLTNVVPVLKIFSALSHEKYRYVIVIR